MIGTVVGIALLGLAVWFAVAGLSDDVIKHARADALPWVTVLAGFVALNVILSGALFWVMTLSFDASPRVGLWRMVNLIAVSGLLNYVPVIRAGLWGRAAFLKLHHGLPFGQSAVMALVAAGLTAAVACVVFGLWIGAGLSWVVIGSAVVVIATAGLWQAVAVRVMGREIDAAWSWVVLRYVDTLVMAGRLWLAMWVVGQPIGLDEALAIGSAALVVRIIGLTPNGLGLSEWVSVWLLSVGLSGEVDSRQVMAVYLPGMLLDRAVEVVVTVIWGGLTAWGLRKSGDR